MKKLITTILLLYLESCVMDSINMTRLINETGEDVTVSVYYNKQLLDSSRVASYSSFLKQQAENGAPFVVSVDTSEMAVVYRVPKGHDLNINRGMGSEPDFASISSVVVQSSRSTTRYSRIQVLKSVKRMGNGFWEWRIK